MKIKRISLCLTLFFCLATCIAAQSADAAGQSPETIKWHNYREGLDKGKQEGKKVFINFYAGWCHYCKVMKKTTFRDKNIIAYLNENFISVRVNTEKEKKLARDHQVQGLPMSIFIGKNGENIGGQPGYLPPEMLLPLLKYVYSDSYKDMDFKKFKEKM